MTMQQLTALRQIRKPALFRWTWWSSARVAPQELDQGDADAELIFSGLALQPMQVPKCRSCGNDTPEGMSTMW